MAVNAAKRNNLLDRLALSVSDTQRLLSHPATVGSMLTIVFLGAVVFTWHKYGPQILQDDRFLVQPENIEITPTPPWIRTDLMDEVVRDGALERLSVHDRHLVEKVADAFAVHSWVDEVKRVRKQSGRPTQQGDRTQEVKIVVELSYRRPIAMVEVVTNRQKGLVPVNADGVILPTVDFSPKETRNYLRLTVPDVQPYGLVGTSWGDQRVHQAAQVAATWDRNWKKLKLYRIVVLPASPAEIRNDVYEFELQTKNGSQIVWGSSPGREKPGEAIAAQKIASLLAYAEQHGDLDKASTPQRLDIRDGTPPRSLPRTANLVLPP
jgi:hypothetical protein